VEIDYAVAQAQQYQNVDELLITNESIWGPGSLAKITSLLAYAKGLRGSLPIQVTTHQRWDVLAGVDNHSPSYAPTRQGLLTMLAACEGCIYANIYPYFDANLWSQLGANPTEAHFKSVVTQSLETTWQALLTAFHNNGITLECRIGEIGWPTQGSQAAQPHSQLATATYAKWHYDAVDAWLPANGVKAYLFEAIDEPWKGNVLGTDSEAFFGKMMADGSATSPGSYLLLGIKTKY
jgi:exo-beta-1,3-glucanase (GH17 family)